MELMKDCHHSRRMPMKVLDYYRSASIKGIVWLTVIEDCPAAFVEAVEMLLLLWLTGDRKTAVTILLHYVICPFDFVKKEIQCWQPNQSYADLPRFERTDYLSKIIFSQLRSGETCDKEHMLEATALHALARKEVEPINGSGSLDLTGALADLQLICTLGCALDARCNRDLYCDGIDTTTQQPHYVKTIPKDYWNVDGTHPATLFGEVVTLGDLEEPICNMKRHHPDDQLFRYLDLWMRGIPEEELLVQ
ncbi:hypothetical protein [Bifidobacterium choloepi]|uniref:hypothetical protein n=1 Tax=Bifidobacterium choloepi TaxID=2614131 RepID=UPI0013D64D9F|nr:hypothetical protein [Bifidobacterium choloepi]